VKVIQATDISGSLEASMSRDLGISPYKHIFKEALFLLSPGIKVAVFASMTAADSGKIPTDEEIIAMGGTETGLDSSILLEPSYSDRVFNKEKGMEIREIICKPQSMKLPSGVYGDRSWSI